MADDSVCVDVGPGRALGDRQFVAGMLWSGMAVPVLLEGFLVASTEGPRVRLASVGGCRNVAVCCPVLAARVVDTRDCCNAGWLCVTQPDRRRQSRCSLATTTARVLGGESFMRRKRRLTARG